MSVRSLLPLLFCSLLGVQCNQKPKTETPVAEAPSTPEVALELKTNAQLGEGAFWNHHTQELYWIDILQKELHIHNPATKEDKTFAMPSRIGTVVPQTDSTAVVALEDGVYIQNLKSGILSQLSNVEADTPGNRFNDGKCDPNGNLWVGSMDLAETHPLAKLYKVTPQGTATAMLDSITISNGIVWTRDAKTMYYIDTPTATIKAFDYDPASATISNGRVAVNVPAELGFPDGMAIDAEDKLWVGMWNGNAVLRFDPLTGQVLTKITVPAHNVTSCAFGGKEFDTLYITTASVDMTEEEKQAYPLAGSVFVVTPGVQGVPSPFFGTPK
ncbi:MAG: SMP-30/gluconolactonase/LRE family protein [Flavobacteriaceae bacterium]